MHRLWQGVQTSLQTNGASRKWTVSTVFAIKRLAAKKCGTDFDVAASFTAHTSICGDKGPLSDPVTSSAPARGVDKVTRKQRTTRSLTTDKEVDLFQLLSDSSPRSTNQRSSEVLRRLVRVRDNGVVSSNLIKDLEVATGVRINVFSRNGTKIIGITS